MSGLKAAEPIAIYYCILAGKAVHMYMYIDPTYNIILYIVYTINLSILITIAVTLVLKSVTGHRALALYHYYYYYMCT